MKEIKGIKNSNFLKSPDKIFGIEKGLIKLFLVPLAIVVIFLMSLGGIIIPKIGEISDTYEKINNIKSQIKLTDEKKNYLLTIDQDQLNKDADYLNEAVLKEKKAYLLVGIIRKIADKFGFQITSFSVLPGEIKGESEKLKVSDKDMAVKMPIEVSLVGENDKSLSLIKAIENSLPVLFIDKFDSSALSWTTELDLTVSSYYIPDKSDYLSGNLTLNDLKLTGNESELLTKISQFSKVEIGSAAEQGTRSGFVKYEKTNPFNP